MATAIPTINSLTRLPLIVNEAMISQTPNEPIIQFCHILISLSFPLNPSLQALNGQLRGDNESFILWYRRAILIPQSFDFCFKESGLKPLWN